MVRFDSGPATLAQTAVAQTAVSQTAPERGAGLGIARLLEHARSTVEGRDNA